MLYLGICTFPASHYSRAFAHSTLTFLSMKRDLKPWPTIHTWACVCVCVHLASLYLSIAASLLGFTWAWCDSVHCARAQLPLPLHWPFGTWLRLCRMSGLCVDHVLYWKVNNNYLVSTKWQIFLKHEQFANFTCKCSCALFAFSRRFMILLKFLKTFSHFMWIAYALLCAFFNTFYALLLKTSTIIRPKFTQKCQEMWKRA